MKIEKLRHPVDDVKVVNKINEIIEVLNNSFLTQEPDEAISDMINSLSTISCDRLTLISNETTCELSVDNLMKVVECGHKWGGVN